MIYAMEELRFHKYLRDRVALEERLTVEDVKKALGGLAMRAPAKVSRRARYVTGEIAGKGTSLYTIDIPITGVLMNAPTFWDILLGMAPALTYQEMIEIIKEGNRDPSVEGFRFIIDSPGGDVSGLDQVAIAIRETTKKTQSFITGLCCSAAYWLASQADIIGAETPTSIIGSIGVRATVWEDRRMWEEIGIDKFVITSTDAPDKYPDVTTGEGRAVIRRELDALHAVFVERVARGRKTTIQDVNANYGRGGVLGADAAVAVGMIDLVMGRDLGENTVSGMAAHSLTSEDREAALIVGMTEAEYQKYSMEVVK